MNVGSEFSCRSRKQSFICIFFLWKMIELGHLCMYNCWTVLVQDLVAFVTEKLYCLALYFWLYWFTLYILREVKQNFRDSCLKWLCYLVWFCLPRVTPVILHFLALAGFTTSEAVLWYLRKEQGRKTEHWIWKLN